MGRAAELAGPSDDDSLARVYGQDPDVANRAIHAWALAMLGEDARAVGEAEAALARASKLRHPFSLLFAYGGAMWTHHLLRDAPTAAAWAGRAIDLSAERAFPYLGVAGRVVRGWARTLSGDADGLTELRGAIAGWRGLGLEIGVPLFLYVQADAELASGDAAAAWNTLDDPLLGQRLQVERWFAAEVARVRVAAARALGHPAADVRRLYDDGLRLAAEQGARLAERHLNALDV
jgi:hypothetical protein